MSPTFPMRDDLACWGDALNGDAASRSAPVVASVTATVFTAVAVVVPVTATVAVALIAAVPLIVPLVPRLAGIGVLHFLFLPALPPPLVPFAVSAPLAVLLAVAPA